MDKWLQKSPASYFLFWSRSCKHVPWPCWHCVRRTVLFLYLAEQISWSGGEVLRPLGVGNQGTHNESLQTTYGPKIRSSFSAGRHKSCNCPGLAPELQKLLLFFLILSLSFSSSPSLSPSLSLLWAPLWGKIDLPACMCVSVCVQLCVYLCVSVTVCVCECTRVCAICSRRREAWRRWKAELGRSILSKSEEITEGQRS